MNTIRPRPFPQRNNGNYNAGNNAADKDGHNPEGQERQQQQAQNRSQQVVARGRAEDVINTTPTTIPNYAPAKNAYSNVQTQPIYSGAVSAHYSNNQVSPQQYQTIQPNAQAAQNQQPINQVSASSKNNKVNIAQILKDFRNTIKAIATPPEIEDEVNRYLLIVEEEVKKPNPQVNLVQSNLKIAAALLDKYISETLNKDSKVVQNWLDALFLQRINYNFNTDEINPNFLVQFPDSNETKPEEQQIKQDEQVVAQTDSEVIQSEDAEDYISLEEEKEYNSSQEKISTKPNITIIPQDTRLKSLFMEAKKHAFSNNPQKAMSIFKEAFSRASELNDNETQSRICLEVGKIYDDNDFVVQALNSYNKSLSYTTDTNVKSKAHFSMAQIYDEINQIEPAINHYMTSVSYAGKSDDLVGQSDTLTKLGNIFTDKYDENSAFDYFEVARKLIEQTGDDNMKGYVLSNTADACVQFRKNNKALKYYAEAVKNYEKTNALEEIAQNYKSAAELMIQFNSPNKAKSLLKKAIINSVKTQNEDLTAEINLLLASIQ